jgi:hypothetical protein
MHEREGRFNELASTLCANIPAIPALGSLLMLSSYSPGGLIWQLDIRMATSACISLFLLSVADLWPWL